MPIMTSKRVPFLIARRAAPWLASLWLLSACGGGETSNAPEVGAMATSGASVAAVAAAPEDASPQGASLQALLARGAALNAAEVQQMQTDPQAAFTKASAVQPTAKALAPVTVYRFYNQATSAHFYTSSISERDSVRATLPFMSYEGAAFQASGQSDTGLSPVFRFFNQDTGVHFYTISATERDHLIATLPQFKYEGIAYYASQVAGTGFRPLYRFFRTATGFHFYTVSGTEAGNVIASLPGYAYEGTAYYVLGTAEAGAPDAPGNHGNTVPVPAAGAAIDTSQPDRVVGTGTPASCTGQAVVNAVAQGGKIRFNCGASPVTINMTSTAKVFNNRPDVTLDGQGLITLNGGGNVRILYQNTCDQAQVWTSPTCQNQETPRLTVQNMRFVNGNSTGQTTDGGGGGAIFVRGGQFKIINSVFTNNRCETTGPDVGGGAVRVLSIYQNRPVYVVQSTFGGGAGLGNSCSNGGALSSIGVSYSVFNSLLSHNTAVGYGANPQRAGTPGGGSGGAIYNDGNEFTLSVYGSVVSDNTAVEGGSAVFYVSNNLTGLMTLSDSVFVRNPASRFGTSGLPGFFVLAAPGQPVVTRTTISY
jgi:hypothetical protein